MKHVKDLIKILLALTLALAVLTFAACGGDGETESDGFDETSGGGESNVEETLDTETESEETVDITFPKDEF